MLHTKKNSMEKNERATRNICIEWCNLEMNFKNSTNAQINSKGQQRILSADAIFSLTPTQKNTL